MPVDAACALVQWDESAAIWSLPVFLICGMPVIYKSIIENTKCKSISCRFQNSIDTFRRKADYNMEFNTIGFLIFGLPPYFVCAVVAFVVATCVFIVLIESKGYSVSENTRGLLISIVGMLVVSRLFGVFTGLFRAVICKESITLETFTQTGIVYYGGLLGLVMSYLCCLRTRLFQNKDIYVLDILAVPIPLFHSISRIGCFLAGCCYGKPWIYGVKYSIILNCEVDITNRIPVQLIEAVVELGIFFYLIRLLKTLEWRNKHILIRYLGVYSIVRFFLEFIRGDEVRGVWNGISFSQIISIVIWLSLLFYIYKSNQLKEDF